MIRSLLAALLAALSSQAFGQTTGVPYFPQTLPANTVIGRLSSGPGPTEAIPFSRLSTALNLGNLTVPLIFQNTVTGSNAASAFTWAGPTVLQGTLTGSSTGTLTWGGDISFAEGRVFKNGARSQLSATRFNPSSGFTVPAAIRVNSSARTCFRFVPSGVRKPKAGFRTDLPRYERSAS